MVDIIDPPFGERSLEEYRERLPALTKGARLVTATAAVLAEEARSLGVDVMLVPNGCDVVREGVSPELAESCVGYLGTLDWRFDIELMKAVASSMPDVRFVLAGRQLESLRERIFGLGSLPNVTLLGPVPYEETDDVLDTFGVGIIPFRTGFLGDAINPVKMYEYLARGLPVVATPIRECLDASPFVRCPRSTDEWVSTIRALITNKDRVEAARRRGFAAQNTWAARADRMIEAMTTRGLLDPTVVRARAAVPGKRGQA